MTNLNYVEPLAEISVPPLIAALPKADLHLHAETDARVDRILAQRAGQRPYDWRSWAQQLLAETPPGMSRLARMAADRRVDAALVETHLNAWLTNDLLARFDGRIAAISTEVILVWGELTGRLENAGHPLAAIDSLIAAIALADTYCLATRNTDDFQYTGVALINPWVET